MEASEHPLFFLSSEDKIIVPFFQRGYVWKEENWADLLTDLFEETKNNFFGTIILKRLPQSTAKSKESLIIDGQQRLTTLSILIKALYESFPEDKKANIEKHVIRYLYYWEDEIEGEPLLKITHSRIDRNNYELIMNGSIKSKIFEDIRNVEIDLRIKQYKNNLNGILGCYKYFLSELKTKNSEELEYLYKKLFNKDNKMFVVVSLEENDNEQTIFDTINSAGVRLSSADIIKNAIFQRALQIHVNKEKVINLFEKHWESVFNKDEETDNFWSQKKVTGRITRDNIEILLHSIAVIKNIFDPDIQKLEQLDRLYKNKLDQIDNHDEIKELIIEIADYAKLYKENILLINKQTEFSFGDAELRLFLILDVCDITTFHPYILHLYKQYSNKKEFLKEQLYKLEKFVIRRFITNQETKSYNKICKEFIKNNSVLDKKLLEISDDEFINGLKNISNKAATLALFWIELKRRYDNKRHDIEKLHYVYTLEHIMPQKWEEYWSKVKITDENHVVIKDVIKARKTRNELIYSLGNMTLITGSMNSSLRNYEFKKKILGDGKKLGLAHYSDLSITKKDIVEQYNTSKEGKVWNEKRIRERTENLAKEALSIWSVPEAKSKKNEVVPETESNTNPKNTGSHQKTRGKLSNFRTYQLNFWSNFNEYLRLKSKVIKARKAEPQNWYDISIGSSKLHVSCIVNYDENNIRCDIYIPNDKELFVKLKNQKNSLEKELGFKFIWEELSEKKASRLRYQNNNIDLNDEEKVHECYEWYVMITEKYKQVIPKYIYENSGKKTYMRQYEAEKKWIG